MRLNTSPEMQHMINMTYSQLIEYLNEKYGRVQEPYFTDSSMSKINHKIKRTNQGLFIHHVAENRYLSLSTPAQAISYSFDLQMPQNLVYCNYIEHLLLHAKIIVEYPDRKAQGSRVGWGGAFTFIIPTLNDMYSGWKPTKTYQNNAWLAISDKRDDYLTVIAYLIRHKEACSQLFTSFNAKFDLWDNKYNEALYNSFVALGAPKYNSLTLSQNDRRMKQNVRVKDQTGDKKNKVRPYWIRWLLLIPAIIVLLIVIAFLFYKFA